MRVITSSIFVLQHISFNYPFADESSFSFTHRLINYFRNNIRILFIVNDIKEEFLIDEKNVRLTQFIVL